MGDQNEVPKKTLTAKDKELILMRQVLEIKQLVERVGTAEKKIEALAKILDGWLRPGVN